MGARRRGSYKRRSLTSGRSGPYRFTPRRAVALKRAQLISAQKRRKGFSRNQKIAIAGVTGAAVLGAAVGYHKLSGSKLDVSLKHGYLHGEKKWEPTGASAFDEHGRFVKMSKRRRLVDRVEPRTFGISRSGRTTTMQLRVMPNQRKLTVSYTLNPLFGRKIPSGGTPPMAQRPRQRVDRDQIPHRNPRSRAAWPHVNPDIARQQNRGLREGTHYLHPALGVREYPPTERGRKAVDNKLLRYHLGLGFTAPPRNKKK